MQSINLFMFFNITNGTCSKSNIVSAFNDTWYQHSMMYDISIHWYMVSAFNYTFYQAFNGSCLTRIFISIPCYNQIWLDNDVCYTWYNENGDGVYVKETTTPAKSLRLVITKRQRNTNNFFLVFIGMLLWCDRIFNTLQLGTLHLQTFLLHLRTIL